MSTRQLSVLLVEDSRLLAGRLQEAIAAVSGTRVVGTVDSEPAAVAALRREPIDVVLIDLNLSRGTGFGVLRAIAGGEFGNVLAIVLTNHVLGEYRRAAAALGATYFLDKMCDIERLPSLLQRLVARAAPDEHPASEVLTGAAEPAPFGADEMPISTLLVPE
ncbi:MAG TPA: response regulator [Steroidobacteraceae bacterium]